MFDLPIKPLRRKVKEAAAILKVHKSTVRRLADANILKWSDGQITTESIEYYISNRPGAEIKETRV